MKLFFICFLSFLIFVKGQYGGYGHPNYEPNRNVALYRITVPRGNYPSFNPMLNPENPNSPNADPQNSQLKPNGQPNSPTINPDFINRIHELFGNNPNLNGNVRIIAVGDPNLIRNSLKPNLQNPRNQPKNKKSNKLNKPPNHMSDDSTNPLLRDLENNFMPNMRPTFSDMIPGLPPNMMLDHMPSEDDFPTVVLPNGLAIKLIDPDNLVNLKELTNPNANQSEPATTPSSTTEPSDEENTTTDNSESTTDSTDSEELKDNNENTTASPLDQPRRLKPKLQPKNKSNKPIQQESSKGAPNPADADSKKVSPKKENPENKSKPENNPSPKKANSGNKQKPKPKLICYPNPE